MTAAGKTEQWIRQGLIEVFCRFDSDNDGIMACHELNDLRAALGNPAAPLSLDEFDMMCREHGLRRINGGLSLEGFLAMYKLTGRQAAVTDLEALGITLGPLLFPRQALMEATRRLVDAGDGLKATRRENVKMTGTIRELNGMLQHTEAKLRNAVKDCAEQRNGVEHARLEQRRAAAALAAQREAGAAGAAREAAFQQEIGKLRQALVEMQELLNRKIEEKEYFQRAVWELEEKANVACAESRAAKAAEFRAKQAQDELTRTNNILHGTLKSKQRHYGRVGYEGLGGEVAQLLGGGGTASRGASKSQRAKRPAAPHFSRRAAPATKTVVENAAAAAVGTGRKPFAV